MVFIILFKSFGTQLEHFDIPTKCPRLKSPISTIELQIK